MRVYLLVAGLFFFMNSPSFAADYDEDETEYNEGSDEESEEDSDTDSDDEEESEDSDEENDQNGSQPYGMLPQSEFMQQQNMMFANQPYIDQNGMIYQNGMTQNYQDPTAFQNNMMNNYQNPYGFQSEVLQNNQLNSYDSTYSENKERIRSIVNDILGINGLSGEIPQTQEQKESKAIQNKDLQDKLEKLREYMGEIVQESKENINNLTQPLANCEDSFLDREVKNVIIKLQERVNGVLQSKIQKYLREMIQSLNGIPLVKKTTVYKTIAPKKSVKPKAKYSHKNQKWNKNPPKKKKYSSPSYQRNYYTVKQFTPKNDVQYVIKPFSSSTTDTTPKSYEKAGDYVIKSWGSQTPVASKSTTSQNNYFSRKSSCGCSK